MKQVVIFSCLVLLFQLSRAQSDSLEIGDTSVRKVMVYKTYDDFLKAAPTSTYDIDVRYIRASKKDTSVIAGKPMFKGDPPKMWGFSDGRYTFVKFLPSLMSHRFWRLQCPGPNPYFFYKQKHLLAAGPGMLPLVTLATTAAIPALHQMKIISKSGTVKEPTKKNLKKLFADSPPLTDSLKKLSGWDDATKIRLVRQYNESH